jgi:hypothetical protein
LVVRVDGRRLVGDRIVRVDEGTEQVLDVVGRLVLEQLHVEGELRHIAA